MLQFVILKKERAMNGAHYKKLLLLFSLGIAFAAVTPFALRAMADDAVEDAGEDFSFDDISDDDIGELKKSLDIDTPTDELTDEEKELILNAAKQDGDIAERARAKDADENEALQGQGATAIGGSGGPSGAGPEAPVDPIDPAGETAPENAESGPQKAKGGEDANSGENSARKKLEERQQSEKDLNSAKKMADDADAKLKKLQDARAQGEEVSDNDIRQAEETQKEAQENLEKAQARVNRSKEEMSASKREATQWKNAQKEVKTEIEGVKKNVENKIKENQTLIEKNKFREGSVEDNLKKEKFGGAGTEGEYKDTLVDAKEKSLKDEVKKGKISQEDMDSELKEYKESFENEETEPQEMKEFKARKEELEKQVEIVRDPPETGEIDIEATKKLKLNAGKDVSEESLQKIKDNETAIKESEERINDLEEQLDIVEGYADWTSWKGLKKRIGWGGEFLLEQIAVGLAFMIPTDIVDALKQLETELALYKTITTTQTFGLIKMRPLPGLIPHFNAEAGVFVYWNVPNDGDYTSSEMSFFGSRNEYKDYITSYLGSGQVASMVDFKTGAVFDGSGIVTDTITLFANITAPGQQQGENLQKVVSAKANRVAGDVDSYQFKGFAIAGADKNVSPHGNSKAAALFQTNRYYQYAPPEQSPYSPIFNDALKAFNYTGIKLSGSQFALRQMQGIGALVFALTNYSGIPAGPNQTPLGKAIATDFTSTAMTQAINNAKVSKNKKHANWTLVNNGTLFDQYLFAVDAISPSMSLGNQQQLPANQGLQPGTQLIGQGIYIYQTDSTPMAQYLQQQIVPELKELAQDYVVCVDESNNIIPAQVTEIVGSSESKKNPVRWSENPNIALIISLVSGTAYLPNGTVLRQADGSLDYQPVNAVLSNQLPNSKSLKEQIGAMRYFAQGLVEQGPFTLREGIKATLVTGLDQEIASKSTLAAIHTQNINNLLGNAASGVSVPQPKSTVSLSAKQDLLKPGGGVYIYKIDNVLPLSLSQLNQDATTKSDKPESQTGFGPDYVVPVTVNQSTGNYLIVPLGNQAQVTAQHALPKRSNTVLALLSLITGRVYDPTYTLISKKVRTNIFTSDQPGKVIKCCTEVKKPDCPAITLGTVACVDGLQVQSGGINRPLNRAFMESALNPFNFIKEGSTIMTPPLESGDTDFISVWPFHFMLLNYDYCPSSVTRSKVSGTLSVSPVATQPFSSPTACSGISTTPTSLINILPESVTGIPWTGDSADVLTKVLDNATKGVAVGTQAETFTQIHTLWKDAYLEKNPWSMAIETGPFSFTINATFNWELTAEEAGIIAGVYLYRITPPNFSKPIGGLWLAAKYDGVGTALTSSALKGQTKIVSSQQKDFSTGENMLIEPAVLRYGLQPSSAAAVQRGRTFSLKDDFSGGVGFDISADPSGYNALINIGDGTVLLKINNNADKFVGFEGDVPAEAVVPVVNYYGAVVQLNPEDINTVLNKNLPPSLQAQINELQAGRTNDWFGPSQFGPFSLFIKRERANKGHYIYETFDNNSPTGNSDDYFIAVNFSEEGAPSFGWPLTVNTNAILSLKTGQVYFSSSANETYANSMSKEVTLYSGGASGLKGFAQAHLNIIEQNTGIPIGSTSGSQDFVAKIQESNSAYYNKIAGNTDVQNEPEESYSEKVLEYLESNNTIISEIGTIQADVKTLKTGEQSKYQVNQNMLAPLFKINGHYYLNNSTEAAGSNWYAFNIDWLKGPISVTPTGVYFQPDATGNLKPQQVLFGHAAKAFAAGHGISISSQDGSETRSLPVERKAIPMLKGVDTNLAGGQTGKLMVMLNKITNPAPSQNSFISQPAGTVNYLYKNIMNLSNITDRDKISAAAVENALASNASGSGTSGALDLITPDSPYDYYIQVNPPEGSGDPYYISLMSGFKYDIDGKPKKEKAKLYFPQSSDSSGDNTKPSFDTTAPLTVWGEGDQFSMLLPFNYNNSLQDPYFFQKYIVSSKNSNTYTMSLPLNEQMTFTFDDGSTISSIDTVEAVYNEQKDEWTLTDPVDNSTIGTFERAVGFNPSVWSVLGIQDSSKGEPALIKNPQYETVVTFSQAQGKSGEIDAFCFGGTLYGFQNWFDADWNSNEEKTDYYFSQNKNLFANITESTSPLLYCSNDSDSQNNASFCNEWPNDIQGIQLPDFVSYLSVGKPSAATLAQYNPNYIKGFSQLEKSLNFYVYQPVYSVSDDVTLQDYANWIQQKPVDSIADYLTMVQYLQNPTPLKGNHFGNPLKKGDSLTTYVGRIKTKITNFFANKLAQLESSHTALSEAYGNGQNQVPTMKSATSKTALSLATRTAPVQMNLKIKERSGTRTVPVVDAVVGNDVNMAEVKKYAYSPSLGLPTLQTKINAKEAKLKKEGLSEEQIKQIVREAIPNIERSLPAEIAAIKSIRSQLQAQKNTITQNQQDALVKFDLLTKIVEKGAQYLYYDEATGYLLYQVQADDIFQNATQTGQFVSYPGMASLHGGFIFNSDGSPAGAVVSTFDLQKIQNKVGGLQVVSTKPLKLGWPKLVGKNGIQFPKIPSLSNIETATQAAAPSGNSTQTAASSGNSTDDSTSDAS
jgi:hypothetical protein